MPQQLQRRSPPGDNRAALRTALQAQAQAQQRVNTLEQALYRAHDDKIRAYGDLVITNNELRAAQEANPTRLAEQYVNAGAYTVAEAPALESAQQAHRQAQEHHDRIESIENEIQAELAHAQQAARSAEMQVKAALAHVLAPQCTRLLNELDQAWMRLRSLRAVCELITHETGAQISQDWISRWQASQPLEADRVRPDGQLFPVDRTLLVTWEDALARLSQDPDTPLPE